MGVWSSGMILALGDFLPKQEDKACERPWVQFPARPIIIFPLFCSLQERAVRSYEMM